MLIPYGRPRQYFTKNISFRVLPAKKLSFLSSRHHLLSYFLERISFIMLFKMVLLWPRFANPKVYTGFLAVKSGSSLIPRLVDLKILKPGDFLRPWGWFIIINGMFISHVHRGSNEKGTITIQAHILQTADTVCATVKTYITKTFWGIPPGDGRWNCLSWKLLNLFVIETTLMVKNERCGQYHSLKSMFTLACQ